MNRILYSACIMISALSFTACNEKEPDHDSSIVTPVKATEATAPVAGPSPVTGADSVKQVQAAPAAATTQQVMTAGLNPAHGQPGHRCDIAVGAPLNSPAAAKPATTQTTQTITPVVTPASTAKTAPGMNPAHGQPGHRCDIAVGAPLNSPATISTATQATPAVKPAETKTEIKNSIPQTSPIPTTPEALKKEK